MYVPFCVFCCIVLFCVLLCVNVYCTVLLPPGVNPITVNKYIISFAKARCVIAWLSWEDVANNRCVSYQCVTASFFMTKCITKEPWEAYLDSRLVNWVEEGKNRHVCGKWVSNSHFISRGWIKFDTLKQGVFEKRPNFSYKVFISHFTAF